ncbi:hypothetical protein D9M73_120680 [compost metagenome]
MRHGFIARQHTARHHLVLCGQLRHALFNRDQVFRRKRTLIGEVVIKAVLNHRPDGDLRIREKLLDRISQQMGRGMADQVQAIGILGRDDGKVAVFFNQVAGIDHLAVHLSTQGCLGKACAYGCSNLGNRHRLGKFAL